MTNAFLLTVGGVGVSRGCVCPGEGVSGAVHPFTQRYPPDPDPDTPPREQNDWQAGVKTLPCRNLADGKKCVIVGSVILCEYWECLDFIYTVAKTFCGTNVTLLLCDGQTLATEVYPIWATYLDVV